jgi:hypothetical protein
LFDFGINGFHFYLHQLLILLLLSFASFSSFDRSFAGLQWFIKSYFSHSFYFLFFARLLIQMEFRFFIAFKSKETPTDLNVIQRFKVFVKQHIGIARFGVRLLNF